MSKQSKSLEGLLSLFSPLSIGDESHAHNQIIRPWAEHLERVRQLLSLNREELVKRTLEEVDSTSDGGDNNDEETIAFERLEGKREISYKSWR